MKYSFVLPAYKAQFLKEAIDSILSQTYTDFELIIVNDASPEDLDSVVNLYNDERIQYYVNNKNIGGKNLVAQWNYSISLSNAEYLILASDDDIYAEDYLLELDRLVQKYPNANVFRPRVRYIDEEGSCIGQSGYLKEFCSGLEYMEAWIRGWACTGIPFYLFKRDALMRIGGFADYPIGWFSDDASVLRLSENGIISTPQILFSFRLSGVSISTRQNSYADLMKKIDASEKFYYEVINYIKNQQATDADMVCVKEFLLKEFPLYMQNNKIRGQLFNSSLLNSTRFLSRVIKMEFISPKTIFRYYLTRILFG